MDVSELPAEARLIAIVGLLLGIAHAARGSGLDLTIMGALNAVCPKELAMAQLHGVGEEKKPLIN